VRLRADRHRPPALGRLLAAGAVLLCLALAGGAAAWAQPSTPEPAVPAAPAEPAVPEPPEPPSRGTLPDEALEEIERALEEVEEQIDDEAEEEGVSDQVRREQRERVREVREQVRRRLREHADRSDNQVAFGSGIHVEEGEVARDVFAMGGPVTVDGDVYGDVVAVGGPITIDGRVTGDVVAIGAGVDLLDDADVLGEVTSVGASVTRAEGAEVMGRINEVAFGPNFSWGGARRGDRDRGDDDTDVDMEWWDWNDHWGWSAPFRFEWFGFVLSLTTLVVLLLFTSLIRLVAGGTVERARARIDESPWLCGLVGLAIELFFIPVLVVVCVILAISIIGIPLLLLIPFVLLAFLVTMVVGYTSSALALGYWLGRRFSSGAASPYVALALGVLTLQSIHILGELFDSFDGFLWVFAVMFGIVGFLVRYLAWTVGLGAVFLGFARSRAAIAPVPPPPPPAPPAQPGDWASHPVDDRGV
jgi:hypothetical protein